MVYIELCSGASHSDTLRNLLFQEGDNERIKSRIKILCRFVLLKQQLQRTTAIKSSIYLLFLKKRIEKIISKSIACGWII